MSFTPLSRTGWTASSNDAVNGAASNVLDGNTSTFWGTNQTMPCWLILDMQTAQTFDCISYLPRQDGTNDWPGAVDIYVSSNGTTWGSPIASYSGLTGSSSLQYFPFTAAPQTQRYLKFQITAQASNSRVYQGAAEFNVGTGTVGNARLTTASVDAVILGAPNVRLTTASVDAVIRGTPTARLSRIWVEAIIRNTSGLVVNPGMDGGMRPQMKGGING